MQKKWRRRSAAKFREETSKKQQAANRIAATHNMPRRDHVCKKLFAVQHYVARAASRGAQKVFLMFLNAMSGMRRLDRHLAYVFVIASAAFAMHANRAAAADSPGLLCRKAIRSAEAAAAIPDDLMAAIARVESGRRDPETGDIVPWPWTVDADGQGFVYETKQAAIAAVRALQAKGVRSIDVGCLQVNVNQHPDAFPSLDQAFDPQANAAYAARFLSQLYERTGAWPKAAAAYHSATPEIGAEYQLRVIAAWPAEKLAQAAALGPGGAGGPVQVAASGPIMAGGRVAVFLPPNRGEAVRVIPLPSGQSADGAGGRSLDSYRATPVALSGRVVRPGG